MELVVGLAILIIFLGLISGLGRPSPETIGQHGEKEVIRKLRSKLDPDVFYQFHDVTLPVGSGTTQISSMEMPHLGAFLYLETLHRLDDYCRVTVPEPENTQVSSDDAPFHVRLMTPVAACPTPL